MCVSAGAEAICSQPCSLHYQFIADKKRMELVECTFFEFPVSNNSGTRYEQSPPTRGRSFLNFWLTTRFKSRPPLYELHLIYNEQKNAFKNKMNSHIVSLRLPNMSKQNYLAVCVYIFL